MILVYVTHKNEIEAKKVINHLVSKKLVACANMFPIQSCFVWEQNMQNENEMVTLLKTQNKLWIKVRDEIKKIHPYKIPCIIKIDVESNKEFEDWIVSETTQLSKNAKVKK